MVFAIINICFAYNQYRTGIFNNTFHISRTLFYGYILLNTNTINKEKVNNMMLFSINTLQIEFFFVLLQKNL